ncbi:MAG: hypothetical protein ACRD20_15175 [Terriglobales bacterium]
MSLYELLENKLTIVLLSAVAGISLTTIAQKILSKTARFRYSTNVQRVAASADDAVFGSVRVTWENNTPVRNLYIAELEIENCSSRDFENVDFKVYVDPQTLLLNERSSVEGTPYIVPWSDSFKASIVVAPGAAPTELQQRTYYHSRDYLLGVFNRGQLLRLNYLCTRPNDDVSPELLVSTLLKGARLSRQDRQKLFYGVPMQIARYRGLVIVALIILACGHYLHSVWMAAILGMLAGLVVLGIGVVEYKAERWIWRLITG